MHMMVSRMIPGKIPSLRETACAVRDQHLPALSWGMRARTADLGGFGSEALSSS
jgi:hypothetical protein